MKVGKRRKLCDTRPPPPRAHHFSHLNVGDNGERGKQKSVFQLLITIGAPTYFTPIHFPYTTKHLKGSRTSLAPFPSLSSAIM
jgi:hypothetical protein